VGVTKGKSFDGKDVFVDYTFEHVMFRWDHVNKVIYRKFYAESEFSEVIASRNGLFNDALRFGAEITADDYTNGKNT
jgi:hypothetical protein